ncbi:UdgX family uracil-DNA binding protein [Pseudosulfitobacter pseudonitzschiae]|uniref:UdgX family uracil-DNA binding protein n=1 Tax=Pseudosulfitobacter pseudonitzschiae TaxID=1402135 RepID=UPI001AF6A8A3|nr:UdgX family uracil-DNA binding protein [Pseudosulfitobacter pseudonitzschiae]MBM1814153.1 UdgX family uracil-DNA binding protein [Pseudosulfitobacter pseudonitzschiae]MBM1831146.1 UdgX family uracil-DNA binding protein [Pseudosulfitobacter pseudonitzschiae]MBM1836013.1 UdgX family uracil-DNA binding protein [Pseudosulfitobacter pseudonitzschiae]MBM1840859.1 UdgX family uracil-DNA binding protein [Pseudosulfitobacter pseudonitzschiae]MBM1845153.1 UdgX family uracil-DNA binding protein [Pseud
MRTIALPRIGTAQAWRDAARGLLAEDVRPEDVLWSFDDPAQVDLFAAAPRRKTTPAQVTVPKSFVDMANRVVWHSDDDRFARLYTFLWRLRDTPALMQDRGDAQLSHLRRLEKNVNRCAHKMKAFVRFRDLSATGPRRRFAAWFEPTHHTVEPTAPFFAKRFGDMDWMIVTPDVTARFEDGRLSFAPGQARPDLPEDPTEDLWGTYFCNIFNPARVKVQAMTSEMPRKYWKNMPETRHIPQLLANAEARARQMQEAMPTLPPLRAERITASLADLRATATRDSLETVNAQIRSCTRCALCGPATQAVTGEGPRDAALMVVGEQPGDVEDRTGRPFVGPAGQLFDEIAAQAGLDRQATYVTNAVKHFKFQQRGKRRMHQAPNQGEVQHCKWWLEAEVALVKPKLILAMGGTALLALTGTKDGILKRRGQVEDTAYGPVLVTLHPSYLLRLPDASLRAAQTDLFRADLAQAAQRARLVA